MSLLSDALKKQQQERGGYTSFSQIPGSEQSAPSEPPMKSMVPSPMPEPPEKKPSVVETSSGPPAQEWVAGVLVAIGLLVVVAGLGLPYYYFIARVPPEPVEEQMVVEVAPDPASVAEPAAVEVEPTPVEQEMAEPEIPDVLPVDEVVAPPLPAPRPEPVPTSASPKAVEWPEIRVQAAMGSAETGSVLIDGTITPVGERYGEMLIREITPQGVLLEYRGEERVVRVRR